MSPQQERAVDLEAAAADSRYFHRQALRGARLACEGGDLGSAADALTQARRERLCLAYALRKRAALAPWVD